MRVEVLEPHGFCAGVTAAIRKAEELLATRDGAKVYCLHELVHNELVVGALRRRGMVFVDTLAEVPEGATVVFSAHGVSPAVRAEAVRRRLRVVDATCPFVEKVHRAVRDFAARGIPVRVIGNPDHAEVRGILGEFEPREPVKGGPLGVVSQTTMNADEVAAEVLRLRREYAVETMAEVCNATKLRQDAVKAFDGDALLVLGGVNSSNTARLCEVSSCPRVFRAGSLAEVRAIDFAGVERLALTSGASTPEDFFRTVFDYLGTLLNERAEGNEQT